MLDELIKWFLWDVLALILFNLGRFYLWCFSLGRIKLKSSDGFGFVDFLVSIFGFLVSLGLLFVMFYLFTGKN